MTRNRLRNNSEKPERMISVFPEFCSALFAADAARKRFCRFECVEWLMESLPSNTEILSTAHSHSLEQKNSYAARLITEFSGVHGQ